MFNNIKVLSWIYIYVININIIKLLVYKIA